MLPVGAAMNLDSSAKFECWAHVIMSCGHFFVLYFLILLKTQNASNGMKPADTKFVFRVSKNNARPFAVAISRVFSNTFDQLNTGRCVDLPTKLLA